MNQKLPPSSFAKTAFMEAESGPEPVAKVVPDHVTKTAPEALVAAILAKSEVVPECLAEVVPEAVVETALEKAAATAEETKATAEPAPEAP